MIPEGHKAEVISNGLHFIRAITEAYGADEGMRLWDTIASTLDPDLKGEMFFAMIGGQYNNRIRVNGVTPGSNKIAVIKAIRSVSGLGLKEAKDMSDHIEVGKKVALEVEPTTYANSLRELRAAGLHVD